MSGIEVHVDTDGIELLHSISNTLLEYKSVCVSRTAVTKTNLVGGLSTAALLDVQVGDQVGQRVGLYDCHDADIREL